MVDKIDRLDHRDGDSGRSPQRACCRESTRLPSDAGHSGCNIRCRDLVRMPTRMARSTGDTRSTARSGDGWLFCIASHGPRAMQRASRAVLSARRHHFAAAEVFRSRDQSLAEMSSPHPDRPARERAGRRQRESGLCGLRLVQMLAGGPSSDSWRFRGR